MRPSAYLPVDISPSALEGSVLLLRKKFPWLKVVPVEGDFSRPLDLPRRRGARTIYFPGSTIGNLTPEEAHAFLRMARDQAERLVAGVDLKKDANVLHAAYNDSRGVTAAFNLNLLARVNRELGGDFDLKAFSHYAFYNAPVGRIEMHLISLKPQTVGVAGRRFDFQRGESIHTENSYKYSAAEFRALAASAGWRAGKLWTDAKGLFALHALQG